MASCRVARAEALLPWVSYLWQVRLFGFPLSVEDPIPVPNPTVDANGRSSFSPAAAEGFEVAQITPMGVPPGDGPSRTPSRGGARRRRGVDVAVDVQPSMRRPLTGKIQGRSSEHGVLVRQREPLRLAAQQTVVLAEGPERRGHHARAHAARVAPYRRRVLGDRVAAVREKRNRSNAGVRARACCGVRPAPRSPRHSGQHGVAMRSLARLMQSR